MKFYWIQMKSQLSWPKEPRALNSLNLDFQLSPDLSSSCFFFFLREIALVWKEIKFYEWPYADKSRVKWCHFHWLTPMTSAFPQTFSMNRNMLRCGLCTCQESNLNHFSWQFYKSCLISPNYRGDSARIPIFHLPLTISTTNNGQGSALPACGSTWIWPVDFWIQQNSPINILFILLVRMA